MLSLGDILEGEITSMTFGGQGILRSNGRVIFVPFTAVHDKVEICIDNIYKNYATGKLQKVLTPSPDRITPRCPYFGNCGGCQLQHISYSSQCLHKQDAVKDTLIRIGKLEVDQVPLRGADLQWEYRRHVKLKLISSDEGWRAGYVSCDNTTLLEIESCPIFVHEADPIFQSVHHLVSKLSKTEPQEASLKIFKDGPIFYLNFEKSLPKNALEVFKDFNAILQSPEKTHHLGKTSVELAIDDLKITCSPQSFIQNHPEQSMAIYHNVCDYIVKTGIRRVLDLYCGIGITSLMLAKRGIDVTGIEISSQSIYFAKQNASQNKLKPKFFQGAVEKLLPAIVKTFKPDCVVINPPRTGLDPKVIKTLTQVKPKELIYISCMPSTLARDLKLLHASGYQLLNTSAFDMFPQTAHVETIAILKLI